jgi:hypothetical protein
MADFKLQYRFASAPWQYAGQGGWVFVSLPKKLSSEIRKAFKREEAGWGRLTATAKIGYTEWKTAVWFDTKTNTYLLPLKAEIRRKEKIEVGKKVEVAVFI